MQGLGGGSCCGHLQEGLPQISLTFQVRGGSTGPGETQPKEERDRVKKSSIPAAGISSEPRQEECEPYLYFSSQRAELGALHSQAPCFHGAHR